MPSAPGAYRSPRAEAEATRAEARNAKIRALWADRANNGVTVSSLAQRFGMGRDAVRRVLKGEA